MSKEVNIGIGLRGLFLVILVIQLMVILLCILFAIIYSPNFLSGIIALAPGILIILQISFVSINKDEFIIRRLFRDPISIAVNQFDKVSIFGILGLNLLKIHFKNNSHFKFLAGGKTLIQIKILINSVVSQT